MPLAHPAPFARFPLVFLTVCTARRARTLANVTAHTLLVGVWRESRTRNGWCVGRYVLMPDHVHLFVRPDLDPQPLGRWVATWKALSARALVANRLAEAPVWQRDYFDRYLRSTESYGDKWDYVCLNPVRAGLAARREDWPYQGVICDLSAR